MSAEMTSPAAPAPAPLQVSRPAGSETARWMLFSAVVFGLALGALRLLYGSALGVSAFLLALAGVVLLLSLRRLFMMVSALAQDEAAVLASVSEVQRTSPRSSLMQEKRRVLRAIKELEFDHSMGKLSDDDHDAIASQYKLRAVELMRALDDEGDLHPSTRAALAGADDAPADGGDPVPSHGSTVSEMSEEDPETALICGACDVSNDADARFCKACGGSLQGGQP